LSVEYRFDAGDAVYVVQVEPAGDALRVSVGGQTYTVRMVARRHAELALDVEGLPRLLARMAADGPRRWIALEPAPPGGPVVLVMPQPGSTLRRAGAAGHDALEAQMPGVVRRVLVAPGDEVDRGQPLLLLEAMKMEIRVTAPHAGRVEAVAVVEGQAVERGQPLVDLATG
jgi:biotin carboxyl carrier protein